MNPLKDMKKNNFKLKKHEIAAIISNKTHDINSINEHIEPWVI